MHSLTWFEIGKVLGDIVVHEWTSEAAAWNGTAHYDSARITRTNKLVSNSLISSVSVDVNDIILARTSVGTVSKVPK